MLKSSKNLKSLKNCKRILSLILAVSMLLSMVTFTVSAEETTETLVATKVFSSLKNNYTTLTDVTSNNTTNRYQQTVYYVFEDVEFISAMSNIVFTVAGKDESQNKKMTVYKISGDIPESTAVSDWKSVWKEVASNIGDSGDSPLTYVIPKLDVSDGDTIVLYLPNCDNRNIGSVGHATYPPTLTYTIDKTAFNTKVLSAVNAATTATELAAVLDTYKKTIDIADTYALASEAEITFEVAQKVFESREENGYEDLTAVKTSYETAYTDAYTTFMTQKNIIVNKVWNLNNDSTRYVDITGVTAVDRYNTSGLYYVFNNIAEASKMVNATFNVYAQAAGNSTTNNTLAIYVSETPFPELGGTTDSKENDATLISTFVSNAKASNSQATYTFENNVQSWKMPSTISFKNGDTIVVKLPRSNSLLIGATYGSDNKYTTNLSYDINKDALSASVLKTVNAATADTIESILKINSEAIGIDFAKYAHATAAINKALVVDADFDSLEAVAEAYNTAYNSVLTEKTINVDQVWRHNTDTGIYSNVTASKSLDRANSETFYVFSNIKDASAFAEATFKVRAQAAGNSIANNTVKWYVSKTPFPKIVNADTVEEFTSAAAVKSQATYAFESEVQSWNLPSGLTLEDGDTVVIKTPQANSVYMACAVHDVIDTQITYKMNEDNYKAKILDLVNNAETEDALAEVLEFYADVIGIGAHGIVYANSTVFEGKPYENLAAVKTAFDAVIDARYIETHTAADMVIRLLEESGKYNDVSENTRTSRANAVHYYIFDDVMGFNESRNMLFSIHAEAAGNSTTNNKINLYTIPAGVDVAYYAIYTKDTEGNSTISGYDFENYIANATSVASVAAHSSYENTIQTWSLPDITIEDGETLVVELCHSQHAEIGSLGYASYVPRISYEVDTEAINEKVLNAINSVEYEDVETIKSIFTTYESIIGIDADKLTLIEDYLTDEFTGIQFESLGAVKATYVECVELEVPWEDHAVEITSEARQTFDGFGYTARTATLSALSDTVKEQVLTNAVDNLNMGMVKLWVNLGENVVINDDGSVDVTGILGRYGIGTGEGDYDYAVAHGVKNFILGPSESIPESMRVEGGTSIAPDKADEYGVFLADVIKALRANNVNITMTTIINESQCGFTNPVDDDNAYIMAAVVEALRARLDDLELTDVKIALPEIANVDGNHEEFYTEFVNNHSDTLKKVDAWAIHSYNMSLKNSFGNTLWNAGIPIISLESCDTAKGAADDYARAATNAARFLNDVNNGTTFWTQYHAMGGVGDATSLVWYNSATDEVVNTASYDYMALMAKGFVPGTTVKKATVDGSPVSYTHSSRKPKINVAAGLNSDNEWVVAVVNGTDDGKSYLDYGFRTYADTYINATITIADLDGVEKDFVLYTNRNGEVTEEKVTVTNGVLKLKLYPREIIMLKEVSKDTSKVIYSNVTDDKAYVRINAEAAMDGVVAEYGANALKDVNFYSLTKGINAISEELSDTTENIGVMTFGGISTLKPNMDKFTYKLAQ